MSEDDKKRKVSFAEEEPEKKSRREEEKDQEYEEEVECEEEKREVVKIYFGEKVILECSPSWTVKNALADLYFTHNLRGTIEFQGSIMQLGATFKEKIKNERGTFTFSCSKKIIIELFSSVIININF